MANFTTEGIVLHKVNYSETSLIIKIFTLNKGLQSFIFQGAKRKHKKGNLISPLSIIQINYFQRLDSDLAKISEIDSEISYKTIPFDPVKSSIVFFINEIIYNSVKEEQYNPDLYHYLKNTLCILDILEKPADFAIKFLIDFTKQLGFYPSVEPEATVFDLVNGKFSKYSPNHPNYVEGENVHLLLALMKKKFNDENPLPINAKKRRVLTNELIRYYQVIFDNFKPIKSLAILEMTFHD
ncbi:MAG: DNA repair protein RecO [Putridiphycobacter sp.]|nr:DNA repair protein RecO [Putridiphycobacter sp.]